MDIIHLKQETRITIAYVQSTNSYVNNFKFIDDDKRKTLK